MIQNLRRTAVKDLATVQGLVGQLLRYDAVTFLTLLDGVRLSEAGSSIWLLHEATHVMYEQVGGWVGMGGGGWLELPAPQWAWVGVY